ncbi:hypothetical protein CWI36_0007p0080 [Hamiltosporidium magnivora]|uniref:Uncharacterized protein n=1 Tax=Hamiltosporidium magnivora TaxID=148818 RepID=A0A4V2JWY1_9MICR|nr:hypothetical protein CWI36_0010p0080 [Hamiltosporidium magnivora]TBU09702.1 hypothetical protein CWI36_0007p0080 [Hamiltosporidium magnivora]
MTIYIKVFKKSNVYRKLYAIIFFIIQFFNTVLAQKTVAIHFYENTDSTLKENFLENSQSGIFQATPYKKYQIFSAELSTEYQKTFLIDLDTFYLKFSNEEEILDGQTYNIYINNSLLSYDEFTYFYNIVMGFPSFIDILNEYNYRLIFTIMNIFKFKHDKYFKRFIRLLWVSVVFNPIAMEKWYSKTSSRNEYEYSCCVSRIALVELLKLYRVSEETLSSIKTDNFDVLTLLGFQNDIIYINEDYLFINEFTLKEILAIHKKSKFFLKILDFFFEIHVFRSMVLFNIFYEKKHNDLFTLSLFRTCTDILLLRCEFTDDLIKKLYEVFESKSLKTLSILYSDFRTLDQISFLKTLATERLNYIGKNEGSASYFSVSEFYLSICPIFSEIIDEMYKYEKNLNILPLDKQISFDDWRKKLDIKIQLAKTKIEEFKQLEAPFQAYISMELSSKFLTYSFTTVNLKEINQIQVYFMCANLTNFSLGKYEICRDIVSMKFTLTKIDNIFLSKILLFTSLKELRFFRATVLLPNKVTNIDNNTKIENIIFTNSSVENQHNFVQFLNQMVGLKKLEISSPGKNSSPFVWSSGYLNLKLMNLTLLKYSDLSNLGVDLFSFPDFPVLEEFELAYKCTEGTIHNIFANRNFNFLQKLYFSGAKLGKKDEDSLEKFTDLLYLRFSCGCKFSDLKLSQLFNLNNTYKLKELAIYDIEIDYCDLVFISNLKSLENLTIERIASQIKVAIVAKAFISIKKIEIANTMISKSEIFEEFGTRLKMKR